MHSMPLKKKQKGNASFPLYIRYSREIPSNVDNTSSERCNFSAAIFSRKCATEDVPGISKIFGERCNSHASATCMGVAPRLAATSDSVEDCSGVKPRAGRTARRQCRHEPKHQSLRHQHDEQCCIRSAHRRFRQSCAPLQPASV